MTICCFSDTHSMHRLIKILPCDVLIFAGDLMNSGFDQHTALDFLSWFSELGQVKHKIFIAGNHDKLFESQKQWIVQKIKKDYTNIIYLEDSEIIINGVKFYGSPVQPYFYNWAFNVHRGQEIKKYWDRIPNDTDILITHGPPHQILDKSIRGEHCGCEELLIAVQRVKPEYHIFGHIHEGRGSFSNEFTSFINCTVVDENYRLVYEPYYFNYK